MSKDKFILIEFIEDFEGVIAYAHNEVVEDRNFWKGERLQVKIIMDSENGFGEKVKDHVDILLRNDDEIHCIPTKIIKSVPNGPAWLN